MSTLITHILQTEDAFRKNRLPSLYSDFSLQKSTNPDGYEVNVSAWEHALIHAAKRGLVDSSGPVGTNTTGSKQHGKGRGNHLLLRADEALLRALEIPEFGVPVALGAVFAEAVQKRTMVPSQLYESTGESLQRKQWSLLDPEMLSPWKAMSWGVRQLRGFVVGSDAMNASPRVTGEELVLVENLKEAADRVVKQALAQSSSKMDLVYTKESFTADFGMVFNDGTELSAADIDILLLYLSRDIRTIAYDGRIIKFRPSNDTSAEITQQDTTIANMRTLMSTMTKQVHNLDSKIAELTSTAKTALGNNNRISALSAIRSKKLAEHNLKQRLDTLTQLEEVYSKIEQATGQVEYVQVMEASTGVLRGLHDQVGGVEKVEDVVDELREEMGKVDEVGNVMNETGPAIDESEIDDEMGAMEGKEREDKDAMEAEDTRRKLAELDNLEQRTAETARAREDMDSALEESTKRLSYMSVQDESRTADREHPVSER